MRELVAGGDRIHAVEGVLSGSLAWLFDHYDGMRPFSGFVREARAAGYTEPDPRIDLSGEDVRRKLLILARAAGLPLQADAVQVDSLVPASLAVAPLNEVDVRLPSLDTPLRERIQGRVSRRRKVALRRPLRHRYRRRLPCERRIARVACQTIRCAAAAVPTTAWRSSAIATASSRW